MQTRPTLPQSDAPTQALGFPKLRLLWANTADVNYSQAIRCDVEVDASGDKIRRNLAVQELTGGFGSMAGDLLGVSSKGALVVALMRSRTVEDRMVDKFNLKKVYRVGLQQKARTRLEVKTSFSLDAKNGIVVLSVTDSDPRRAAAIVRAYVEELNTLMAQLNNSSAHRERVFLQDQLQTVTVDMETAEKQLSEFASKNAAMSINEQVRVMIESTAKLQGQLIAAESQLQEVREIYRDSSPQVRSLQARIGELVHQQKKLMGSYRGKSFPDGKDSGSSFPTLRQLPIMGVPYESKVRKLKMEEAVYEMLRTKFDSAKAQEARENSVHGSFGFA